MGYSMINLPPQQLPENKKNKEWKQKHLDWAAGKSFFNYNPVRKSILHKKINYDLVDGILHLTDLELVLNPSNLKAGFIPDNIQHYPIINAKLHVLKGEEIKRIFDAKVVVTNPNAISQIEQNKKQQLLENLQQWVQNTSLSEEDAQKNLQEMGHYFMYEWQDMREVRANTLLNHYMKEYNMPEMFNAGFMDAMIVGEEIYQCYIDHGEPCIRRLNPLKVHAFRSGYDNKFEKSDVIIIEDYWSPGKIYDTFYDVLLPKDREYIEKISTSSMSGANIDSMDNIDERYGFINMQMIDDTFESSMGLDGFSFDGGSLMPYDMSGNIRVLQMYWKSRRKIKEIKSYDQVTGEETYDFYDEFYTPDESIGEEETVFWINEAWEGVLVGEKVYLNIRPCPVQFNVMSNPSKCHFGIIGSIYNINDDKPYSLVDMMKPYSYYYDVIHDRLNKLIARNWGAILKLDLAKKPKGWDVDKWMYYAKTMGIAVEDSFNEGSIGPAMGKLAGALNNASSGVINASDGNQIQSYINILQFIKQEMSEAGGITPQREGQVSSNETVGGVERATLQSNHITEWLFTIHDSLKKRVLECFLEVAKAAMRGKNKKFQYITSDLSQKVVDIDGDEFAESDYGLVVDSGAGVQALGQKLDMLAQAALQNQSISFSTMMKLYNSASLSEKQKYVEANEQEMQQRQQEQAQQEQQLRQQQMELQQQLAAQQQQFQMQFEQMKQEFQDKMNERDNMTRIRVAEIQKESYANWGNNMDDEDDNEFTTEEELKLKEQIREFDEKMKLEREKLYVNKQQSERADRIALSKQAQDREEAIEKRIFDEKKLKIDSDLKSRQISKSSKK